MTGTGFQCGLEAVLEILGGKWKPLIVYHFASGAKRTGQLRRLVTNMSEKTLIQHLKELVDDGVIRRIDFKTVPPHVVYELTDFGRSLSKVLAPLCEWGAHHTSEVALIVQNRKRSLVVTGVVKLSSNSGSCRKGRLNGYSLDFPRPRAAEGCEGRVQVVLCQRIYALSPG